MATVEANAGIGRTRPSPDWLRAFVASQSKSVRSLASSVRREDRLRFARTVTYYAIAAYWQEHQSESGQRWPLRDLPGESDISPLAASTESLAQVIGKAAAKLDGVDAAYLIGSLYTGMMPKRVRAQLGAYYTPPALCERLLDMAADAGVDWQTARVLDPACGGGAFLAPVARRMAESMKNRSASVTLGHIQHRLHGFELDAFAGWMAQVFVDVTLDALYDAAGERLVPIVQVTDAMEREPTPDGFDLVVGNPPYGRARLTPALRKKFRRSLFGHANLYGVFTDLALRLARPGGVIAYVTPTSFLAGEYFKALRVLLGWEAPPVSIDFVGARKGVFADVLQETLLAVYRRGKSGGEARVHLISPMPNGSVETTATGSFRLPESLERPWLVPRTKPQFEFVRRVEQFPCRLADYGYSVSTGPLVWNRHKASLRQQAGEGRYPLIWAESVRSGGSFEFRARKRNHQPYFEPGAGERWVVTDFPCVLLQRTTAKEQNRRLIAAELPLSFIEEHGAVVVENHLNMIKPMNGAPKVRPALLAALLNSKAVDQAFRCISGSVAVSAYELNALPLPPPENLEELENLAGRHAERDAIERAANRLYGYESS